MQKIDDFRGKYDFLSNFFAAPVTIKGHSFQNNEAAFQSMKCPERFAEFECLSPVKAKRLGQKVELRPDWDEVKLQFMHEICLAKFTQNEYLGRMLIATGDAQLEEGNDRHDTFWGVCNGEGQNNLGKILMKVRAELKNKTE